MSVSLLEMFGKMEPAQQVIIITQGFTFLGTLVAAVGTFLVSRQNARAAKQWQEIKVEINGKMAALMQAHGDAKKSEGFIEGRLAERASPAIPVEALLSAASGLRGLDGNQGLDGNRGPPGPTGPAGPVVIVRTPALPDDPDFPPEPLKTKLDDQRFG